jgi:hypothetical protein
MRCESTELLGNWAIMATSLRLLHSKSVIRHCEVAQFAADQEIGNKQKAMSRVVTLRNMMPTAVLGTKEDANFTADYCLVFRNGIMRSW